MAFKVPKIPKIKVPRVEAPLPPSIEHDWSDKEEPAPIPVPTQEVVEPKPQALIIGKEYIDKQYVWKLKANYDIGQVGDIID